MITTTHTLATDTLANGNDIDLVKTTAPDDMNYWNAEWYWLVQIITPKGEYIKSDIHTNASDANMCYTRYVQENYVRK